MSLRFSQFVVGLVGGGTSSERKSPFTTSCHVPVSCLVWVLASRRLALSRRRTGAHTSSPGSQCGRSPVFSCPQLANVSRRRHQACSHTAWGVVHWSLLFLHFKWFALLLHTTPQKRESRCVVPPQLSIVQRR